MSTSQKQYISLVARHTLYASLLYYLLLLVADILLGGAISFFFKVGALMGLVLASALVLAFVGRQEETQKPKDSRHKEKSSAPDSSSKMRINILFYVFLFVGGILLFFSLRPHDTLVAALLALLTPLLAVVNKKTILS